MTKSLRISPSAINTFFKCSMQYKWNVIDELEPDPGTDNLYAVLGSTLHKASELQDKFNIPFTELKTAWKILFLNFMTESKNLDQDCNYEKFLSRGYDLLKNLVELKKKWINKVKVLSVEKYHRIPYKNPFINDICLSGKIDVSLKSLEDEMFTALDWKSSKNENIFIDDDLQMSFYIYFIHIFYKVDFDKIFGALAYPANLHINFTQRTEEDLQEKMFKKIDLMLERISKDDFKKEPKIGMNLNDCTFCPFIKSCGKL